MDELRVPYHHTQLERGGRGGREREGRERVGESGSRGHNGKKRRGEGDTNK